MIFCLFVVIVSSRGKCEFLLRLLAKDLKGFVVLMLVLVGRLGIFHLEEAEFSIQVPFSSPIIIIHLHYYNDRTYHSI
jgi:hypothetical protein